MILNSFCCQAETWFNSAAFRSGFIYMTFSDPSCRFSGTSNWSGDYFLTTAGVGLVISQHSPPAVWKTALQSQLSSVFNRDWNSEFAVHLADLRHHPDCTLSDAPL